MMNEIAKKEKDAGAWLKVFCPEVRSLSEEEILSLPEDYRRGAEAEGKKGVWLEVLCPDHGCVIDESKIAIRIGGAARQEEKGFWLKLFCPEDRCFANEPTDLP